MKYYFYTAKKELNAKQFVSKFGHFYLFEKEPSYELIEKHDLRLVHYGTIDEVSSNYF